MEHVGDEMYCFVQVPGAKHVRVAPELGTDARSQHAGVRHCRGPEIALDDENHT